LLTGGSAFGLAAADGVMTALEEKNIGFDVITLIPHYQFSIANYFLIS